MTGNWYIDVDGVTDANAYTFNKGRVYITIYGNGAAGSQTLIADALRFRFISASVGDWQLY